MNPWALGGVLFAAFFIAGEMQRAESFLVGARNSPGVPVRRADLIASWRKLKSGCPLAASSS
jgi:hypothetical protein